MTINHEKVVPKELNELRETLFNGICLSKQSSYGRRAPSSDAIPFFQHAWDGLHTYVNAYPNDADGWSLLSQTEECLLHYDEARKCLERSMDLTGRRSQHDLKKLALYDQMAKEWSGLMLTPSQLGELGEYLRRHLTTRSKERSFKWTEKWLREHGFTDSTKVIESIRAKGAFDDFRVADNLARGWFGMVHNYNFGYHVDLIGDAMYWLHCWDVVNVDRLPVV
jgi:hypothetical protein